ncbi:unnamed protein product [Chironomus riparius]|uniref:Uncharacterized protein n=1 Tax=Chironomus riparius TaxID=315576 RepID=A0A9P0IU56_9DIPT|nr:unnamed protein product [Chironomus riparius]
MRLIIITIVFLIYQASHGLPHEPKNYDDHEDSDMWMEADELPPPEYSVVRSESRVVRQYSSSPSQDRAKVDTSVSRVEHYEPQVVIQSSSSDPHNPTAAEQTFFPFLANIPSIRPFQISSSLAASIANRYNPPSRLGVFDQSILGSGDFTVMRGGTFYPDDEDPSKRYQAKSDQFYTPNYDGKPVAEALTGKKEPYYPEDPFENFKDFADMTSGSDPAFSHYVVIYANKNSTKPHPSHPSPKNIFEQLQMIDREKLREKQEVEDKSDEKISDKKLMKLSKYKNKLSKTKIVKKYKKKLGPKVDQQPSPDYTDPLLATS